jgi:hypothetical protein
MDEAIPLVTLAVAFCLSATKTFFLAMQILVSKDPHHDEAVAARLKSQIQELTFIIITSFLSLAALVLCVTPTSGSSLPLAVDYERASFTGAFITMAYSEVPFPRPKP